MVDDNELKRLRDIPAPAPGDEREGARLARRHARLRSAKIFPPPPKDRRAAFVSLSGHRSSGVR